MLDEALAAGTPAVFDTGQGGQFTAGAWVERVEAAGVAVSMDGRGRCLDTVFAERLWRAVKSGDVFLRGYDSVPELERGLRAYFAFDNVARVHQSLGYKTPAEVYRAGRSKEPAREWRRIVGSWSRQWGPPHTFRPVDLVAADRE